MVVITEEMREVVEGQRASYVATATKDGRPNVSPKGTLRVLDDQTLVFADLFSEKTRRNLQENPQIAVTVADEKRFVGYQFRGTAELIDKGPLFDAMAEELKNHPMNLPKARYLVKIRVEEIFDLRPGAKEKC
jgi:hypothetical protein